MYKACSVCRLCCSNRASQHLLLIVYCTVSDVHCLQYYPWSSWCSCDCWTHMSSAVTWEPKCLGQMVSQNWTLAEAAYGKGLGVHFVGQYTRSSMPCQWSSLKTLVCTVHRRCSWRGKPTQGIFAAGHRPPSYQEFSVDWPRVGQAHQPTAHRYYSLSTQQQFCIALLVKCTLKDCTLLLPKITEYCVPRFTNYLSCNLQVLYNDVATTFQVGITCLFTFTFTSYSSFTHVTHVAAHQ